MCFTAITMTAFIARQADRLSFLIALAAMLGSLYYSEIIGFAPCKLCWWQRIFFYPLVFILGLGICKKDKNLTDYTLLLSALGGLIAFYQVLLERGLAPSLTCLADGAVSCSYIFVMYFGFLTIPFMSWLGFSAIFVMQLIKRYHA